MLSSRLLLIVCMVLCRTGELRISNILPLGFFGAGRCAMGNHTDAQVGRNFVGNIIGEDMV
jgi:hypothetical protein